LAEDFSLGSALKRSSSFLVYSSLSRTVDGLLGGGYRAGTVTEIYGKSNTGKTQLTMQAVMAAASMGQGALFIDTEGAFRPERIESMASQRGWNPREILGRVVYLRATDSTQQREVIRRLNEREATSSCGLVAIDTLTANFSLDYPGSANLPRRQGAVDVHLSEIARDSYINGRAYILANRVVSQQDGTETHVGGRTVEQMVHRSMHLVRQGDGIRVTLQGPGRHSATAILGAAGFD
jgi:RecA/RadA recombinase